MAYTDTPGDILRVTIAALYPDTQVQEVNHNFVCGSSGGGDSRTALGAAVLGVYVTNYAPVMSSVSSLYGYKVALVNRPPPPFPKALVSSTPGALTVLVMPTQVRPILGWQTAQAGRGFRGRNFLFTPADTMMGSTGYPNTTMNTATAAVGAAIGAGFSVGGSAWAPVVAHRHKGPPVTWTFTLVANGFNPAKFGTQRKSGNYGRVNSNPW
jgi:hypothetical protein